MNVAIKRATLFISVIYDDDALHAWLVDNEDSAAPTNGADYTLGRQSGSYCVGSSTYQVLRPDVAGPWGEVVRRISYRVESHWGLTQFRVNVECDPARVHEVAGHETYVNGVEELVRNALDWVPFKPIIDNSHYPRISHRAVLFIEAESGGDDSGKQCDSATYVQFAEELKKQLRLGRDYYLPHLFKGLIILPNWSRQFSDASPVVATASLVPSQYRGLDSYPVEVFNILTIITGWLAEAYYLGKVQKISVLSKSESLYIADLKSAGGEGLLSKYHELFAEDFTSAMLMATEYRSKFNEIDRDLEACGYQDLLGAANCEDQIDTTVHEEFHDAIVGGVIIRMCAENVQWRDRAEETLAQLERKTEKIKNYMNEFSTIWAAQANIRLQMSVEKLSRIGIRLANISVFLMLITLLYSIGVPDEVKHEVARRLFAAVEGVVHEVLMGNERHVR